MSLDLSTLQERYPHGSRWRNDYWPAPSIITVVGWDPGDPSGDLVITTGTGGAAHARVEHTLVRIPDPSPCPITEPVTLHGCHVTVNGDKRRGTVYLDNRVPITLHPPDSGIDVTAGNYGFYTWGET